MLFCWAHGLKLVSSSYNLVAISFDLMEPCYLFWPWNQIVVIWYCLHAECYEVWPSNIESMDHSFLYEFISIRHTNLHLLENYSLNHKRCTAFWMEMLAPISANNSEVLRHSSIYFVVLNYKLASILAKFIKRCWCLNTSRGKLPNLSRDPWPDEWKLLPPKRRLLLHLSRNWNSE